MQGINYLAETTKFADTFGNDWLARFVQVGIPTAILGIATVFVVLALIWGCLEIFKYVFYTLPEKRKKADATPKTEVKAEVAPSVEETADDEGEIVAAIIAAITAMRSEEAAESGVPSTGFRVVSFRKR